MGNQNRTGTTYLSSRPKLILRIFIDTLITSTLAFGGGFVVLNMIRDKFCRKYGWITEDEVTDLIALAQSSPGTIAGNALMLVGYTVAGFWGSVAAMVGSIIPPLLIISLVSVFYDSLRDSAAVVYLLRGLQTAVGAVIASLCIDMMDNATKRARDIPALVICALSLLCSFVFNVHAIYIIVVGALLGMIVTLIREKSRKGEKK
jgi:chromate transporter